MKIICENIHKKYRKHYIIKDFSYEFKPEIVVGIKGSNGSGKSTLLQMISSVLTPSSGIITYIQNGVEKPISVIRQSIAFVAPAAELLGTLTLQQTVNFHFNFKEFYSIEDLNEFYSNVWLENHKNTLVNDLSSGMRQRLKLGLAFYSKSDYILLDEPTSNLDKEGIQWVNNLIEDQLDNRGLIIASNEDRDFEHCESLLNVMDYK